MPLVVPTPPTALPTPPSTSSPSDFDSKADAFLGALPTNQTQTNQLAQDTYTNASYALDQATTAQSAANTAALQAASAAASATAAASAGNATKWVTSTNYNEGTCIWSPVNFQTYRKITPGNTTGGTTDPSVNTSIWARVGSVVPDYVIQSFGVI